MPSLLLGMQKHCFHILESIYIKKRVLHQITVSSTKTQRARAECLSSLSFLLMWFNRRRETLSDSLIQVDKRKEPKQFLLIQHTHCKIIFISPALDYLYAVQIHMLLLALMPLQQSAQSVLSSSVCAMGTSSILQTYTYLACLVLTCGISRHRGCFCHFLAFSLQRKLMYKIFLISFPHKPYFL